MIKNKIKMIKLLNENNVNKTKKTVTQSIPIVVSKSKWSADDKIMSRIYEFDNKEKSVYFMQQVMQYISNSEHNIEARFKKEKCTIIIRAISPYITEYEQDVAKYFDKIYKDTDYLKIATCATPAKVSPTKSTKIKTASARSTRTSTIISAS